MGSYSQLVVSLGLSLMAASTMAEGFDTLLAKQKPGLWEMRVLGNVQHLCVTEKSKLDARDAVQNNPYCKAIGQNFEGDKFSIDYSCDVPGMGNVKMSMTGTSASDSFHAEAHYQLPANNAVAQALASQLQSVAVEGIWQRACTAAESKAADGEPVAPARSK